LPIRLPTLNPAIGRFTPDPQVVAAVRDASATTGARFDTLLASAALESGLNSSAKASTSSASGLFQFTDQTWLAAVRQYGAAHGLQADAAAIVPQNGQLTVADPVARQRILNLRFDPAISATMAGDHLRGLAASLTTSIGHAPDAAETYLAHFLGTAGATQMLHAAQTNPGGLAADVLPEAALANPAAFKTADGTPRTAAQFVQRIRSRVAQAFVDVGSAMPQGALAFAGQSAATGLGSGSAGGHGSVALASATPSERAMAASLIDVFTRLDRGETSSQTTHGKRNHGLPYGLVSALANSNSQDPEEAPAAGASKA
jgi:hypothetical protein